jgi:DNA-binding transcriptional MerR regulator
MVLFDEAEAAAFLKVPVRTLQYYRAVREGPAWHRVEGHVRYSQEDLIAYLTKNRVDPQSAEAGAR